MRTKVLTWIAALPILAGVAIAALTLVLFLFSGLGVSIPIFHKVWIVVFLAIWFLILICAAIPFRFDTRQNARD
jgi:hypothetical protein